MEQVKIKQLLLEASAPDCTWQRRNKIQCELGEATASLDENGVYSIDDPEAGIHTALSHLYVKTLQNKAETLPKLLPFFLIACGDRTQGSLFADIDWSLVD